MFTYLHVFPLVAWQIIIDWDPVSSDNVNYSILLLSCDICRHFNVRKRKSVHVALIIKVAYINVHTDNLRYNLLAVCLHKRSILVGNFLLIARSIANISSAWQLNSAVLVNHHTDLGCNKYFKMNERLMNGTWDQLAMLKLHYVINKNYKQRHTCVIWILIHWDLFCAHHKLYSTSWYSFGEFW